MRELWGSVERKKREGCEVAQANIKANAGSEIWIYSVNDFSHIYEEEEENNLITSFIDKGYDRAEWIVCRAEIILLSFIS